MGEMEIGLATSLGYIGRIIRTGYYFGITELAHQIVLITIQVLSANEKISL